MRQPNSFMAFVKLAERYRKLNRTCAHRYEPHIDKKMRKAFKCIAMGRRDEATDLIGPYGFRWCIIEDLLCDIHAAGFHVDAVVGA